VLRGRLCWERSCVLRGGDSPRRNCLLCLINGSRQENHPDIIPTHTEPPIGRIVAHGFELVPDGEEVVVVVVGFEDIACLCTYAVRLIDQDVSSIEDNVHALLIGKAFQGRSKFRGRGFESTILNES